MMFKLLWTCLALVALFATVESLTCSSCDVGILRFCFYHSYINCSTSQTNCYIGEAKFNVSELVTLHASGCIEAESCINETGTILTAGYTISRTCCSTDLCNEADNNGGASIQLHLLAALGAALVSMWSTWRH